MYECESCGTESAEALEAWYHLKGKALGEYKSRVNVCAECLAEVKNFRPHHTNPALKWRLIPV
jgi:hypothetical protein